MKPEENQNALVLHGLGMFYHRWRRIYEQTDKESIARFVGELREAHPNDSEARLAFRVLRKTARSSALVGVATATPALLPGLGTAISVISLLPEERYLMRLQCEMVLRIATVYGFDATDESRLTEVISLCTSPTQAAELLSNAKYDLGRVAMNATVQLSNSKAILGMKAASRGVIRRIPVLGFLAGGALNYYTFISLGQQAGLFYSALARNETKR